MKDVMPKAFAQRPAARKSSRHRQITDGVNAHLNPGSFPLALLDSRESGNDGRDWFRYWLTAQ